MSTQTLTTSDARRIAQFLYLRPECVDQYKKVHEAVWSDVLAQIKDSNIEDYSIFLTMTPRPILFASFKYVGKDFEADMARMAANTKVKEWWAMTDSMQESPVQGAKGSAEGPAWWAPMEEVFRME